MSNEQLLKLRAAINKADKELVAILARRFSITKKVGEYKKKHDLMPYDKKREQEMFIERSNWATKHKLNPELIIKIFKAITKESRANHAKIKEAK